MNAVIITGGLKPSFDSVANMLTTADMIAAADSGYDWALEHNVEVDFVIGDMDSMKADSDLPDIEVLRYPVDKDYTDTELAVAEVRKRGAVSTGIIGGGGGRLDHLLGIIALFHRENPPQYWVSSHGTAYLIDSPFSLKLPVHSVISVFPVGSGEVRLHSTGLHWPLDALQWSLGDVGISNYTTMDKITITPICGRAIAVLA